MLEDFYKSSACKDGYRNVCKACYKVYRDNYNLKNKDKIKAAGSLYYKNNKDKILKRIKEYRDHTSEYRS